MREYFLTMEGDIKESDNQQLLIREAEGIPEELEILWDLNCRAFKGMVSDYDYNDPDQKAKFIEELERMIDNPREKVLVGTVDHKIVGLVGLQETGNKNIGEVIRVRVLPEYQAQRYGSSLMLKLEEVARDLNYKELVLGTSSRLKEANKMYEKLGFKVISRTPMLGSEERYGVLCEDIKYSKKI